MTYVENQSDGRSARRPTVTDVVELSDRGAGFAYARGEVLVRQAAQGRVGGLAEVIGSHAEVQPLSDRERERGAEGWLLARRVERPLDAVDVLLAEGYDAQPNHVMVVHECGSPCPPHPAVVQQLVRFGLLAHPMGANPMGANPMGANPMGANPMGANPMGANHSLQNSAVPVDGQRFEKHVLAGPGRWPHVIILDTGLAGGTQPQPTGNTVLADGTPDPTRAHINHTPDFLANAMAPAGTTPAQITGRPDFPDVAIDVPSRPPVPADHYLDPAAGHGTFIAGIIEQLAPGCHIDVRRVIGPLGDAKETVVAEAIHAVVDAGLPRPLILSLSFGGQAPRPPGVLREAVARAIGKGIPIIASAGNDGVCTPQYPAAFPGVIAVAALGPDGPAPWTNYGDWVDACAPGTDLVSTFFKDFDGPFPTLNSYDPDHFTGWAQWSGTSFAVPVVVAAVARELVCGRGPDGNLDAVAAVDRVVRAPHLARLPCLGTIINI